MRSTALKKIIQNYSNEGIETLKYVIKSDFSPLVFKTLLLETDAIEGGELSVTIKEDLLDKFETLFGVVREEAKFFLDLYRIFAIENNFFNIEEQWSKDYWPSSVGDIDKQHWIAIKDGHVQALNLNRYKLGEIPPSIHFLHELKHLNIINNRLLDVPNSLFPHVIGIITEKYFREGIEANDASVLAILELLTTIYKDESSSLKYN